MNKTSYLNHIQGLRAIAVIFVIFYHLTKNFSFGYVGVDIFFVISGFVISKSIYENLNNKNYIIYFFFKRLRRILPVLLFVLVISMIAYFILGNLVNSDRVIKTFITSTLGISNIYFLRNKEDYFAENLDNLFIHTWSLGVEEQFYFFYPFLFLIIFFLKKEKIFLYFLSSIIILSLIYFIIESDVNKYFWSPFSRFWEIGFGCLIFFFRNNFKIIKKIIFFSFLLIIFFYIFNLLDLKKIFLFLTISSTGYLITLNKKNNLRIFLEHKYLLFVGKISYSLYLVHYPFLYFLNIYFETNLINNLTYLLIIFITSTLTYKFIEKPFKKIKFQLNNKSKKVLVSIPISLMIAIFLIYNFSGLRPSFNFNNIEEFKKINLISNKFQKYFINTTSYKEFTFENISPKKCLMNSFDKKIILERCFQKNNSNNLILAAGDSHSAHLMPILLDKSNNFDVLFSNIEGGLYVPEIIKFENGALSLKVQEHFYKTINLFQELSKNYKNSYLIISSNYLSHTKYNKIYDINNKILNDEKIIASKIISNFEKYFQEKNINVIFISALPEPPFSIYECLQEIEFKNKNKNFCDYKIENNLINELNVGFSRLDNSYKNINFFNINKFICSDLNCNFFGRDNLNNVIITDQSHLSSEFSLQIKDIFYSYIKGII